MNRCPFCSHPDTDWIEGDDDDETYLCPRCGQEHYRRRTWYDDDDDQAPATVPEPTK